MSASRTLIEKSIWSRLLPNPPAAFRFAMIELDDASTVAAEMSRVQNGATVTS